MTDYKNWKYWVRDGITLISMYVYIYVTILLLLKGNLLEGVQETGVEKEIILFLIMYQIVGIIGSKLLKIPLENMNIHDLKDSEGVQQKLSEPKNKSNVYKFMLSFILGLILLVVAIFSCYPFILGNIGLSIDIFWNSLGAIGLFLVDWLSTKGAKKLLKIS